MARRGRKVAGTHRTGVAIGAGPCSEYLRRPTGCSAMEPLKPRIQAHDRPHGSKVDGGEEAGDGKCTGKVKAN